MSTKINTFGEVITVKIEKESYGKWNYVVVKYLDGQQWSAVPAGSYKRAKSIAQSIIA